LKIHRIFSPCNSAERSSYTARMKDTVKFVTLFAQVVAWNFEISAFVQPTVVSLRRNNNFVQSRLYGALEPLATEGDWTAYLDEENTGLVYYFNGKTGVSVWEKPSNSFPDVVLRGSMKRIAAEKQEAYLKSVAENDPNIKKGFFQSIMDSSTSDTKASTTASEVKKEEADWFSPIYEQSTTSTSTINEKGNDESIQKKPDGDSTIEKPKDKGFFDNMFGSTKEKVDPKIEGKEAEKSIDVGGFLGNIFKSATSALDAVGTETTSKIEELSGPDSVGTTTTTEIPIKIDSAAYVLPHPAKIFWGGEDAVFIKGRTFGVFDGVSGATKLDGVPLYSKTLANEMKKLIPNDKTALSTPDLTRLLSQSAETADKIATGASTAVVASIGDDGFLRALNVGDSTCMVVRNGKVIAKTREISHYFECPYQLSANSPDRPRDGTKLNVELMRGDIIFMASDGVFDNLSDTAVAEMTTKEKQLSQMAKRISDMSRKVSQDRKANTPYAKQAQKYGDPEYTSGLGGKLDDVSCVVVAYG
jgi:protein phosphatase PTC7